MTGPERDQVIDSYKHAQDKDAGRTVEDALRDERDVAEGELLDIAAHLGCSRGEIIETIRQLQKEAGCK